MHWKNLLESISESVNDHLRLRNDYLVTENRILRNQIAPLTLYTTRNQQYISRDFGPPLETTNTLYGLNWNINLKNAPMRLIASHREEEQDDLSGIQAFSVTQDNVEWGGTYKFTPHRSVRGQ